MKVSVGRKSNRTKQKLLSGKANILLFIVVRKKEALANRRQMSFVGV